jgi:hypothetical protein
MKVGCGIQMEDLQNSPVQCLVGGGVDARGRSAENPFRSFSSHA